MGPVGLLNVNGFYDLLLLQLDKMIEEGFLRAESRALLVVAEDPATLLTKMEAYRLENRENKPLDRSLYVDNK
jgi:predicted Rossmann-fold nucleotide-binding protein